MATLAITVYIVLTAAAVAKAARHGPPPRIASALHAASARYSVPYWQLRNVSACESVGYTDFYNGPGTVPPYSTSPRSVGLFQFLYSTWLGTPYRRFDRMNHWANAMAAAWLVRQDGGWSEWVCKP
jgi:hypothetical protein